MVTQGRAIKKPIPVYFYHYSSVEDVQGLEDWIQSHGDEFDDHMICENCELQVKTKEGTSYNVREDYYILRGNSDEYWPIAGFIFRETYNILG